MNRQPPTSNPGHPALTEQLLAWYQNNQRDLPWRHQRQPYAVWISEIMAQQTRITTLLPYYQRFMKAFPTVEALAQADVNHVLSIWAGLGYYTRAHHLHQAAQRIMEDFGGNIPDSHALLCSLPGIGDYTAGAICSIAFQQPVVPIDGNISRVYARLDNCHIPIQRVQFKKAAKAFLTALIPHRQAGDFAQALMELGSMVCLPKHPRCGTCPLSSYCQAFQGNRQHDLPVRVKAKALEEEQVTVILIINHRGDVLVRQRKQDLLKGLWQYYQLQGWVEADELIRHLEEWDYSVASLIPLGRTSHTFSHLIWHMQGYACSVAEEHPIAGHVFVPRRDLTRLALPAALRFYTKWLHDNAPDDEGRPLFLF